jgi:pimeloyl-ACP methyl ester carboxylesterase
VSGRTDPRRDAWDDRGGHLWTKDREVVREDGTVVRYAVRGPVGGPVVAFCAGYLCPDNFWRDLGPDLARDHRVVMLNYRGVGASSEAGGGAKPPDAESYRMEHLADDVAAVLDAESLNQATVVGHSMGVQVALDLWRRRPDLAGRLALIAGPYGSPLKTFYSSSVAANVFPLVSIAGPALPRNVLRPLMHALELPVTMPVARGIRALGPHTPEEGMRGYRWHLGRVDPRTAIWTARGMAEHDAEGYLPELDVPVLVAVGGADSWCPASVGDALLERVPHADLLVVPEASHGLPIEFPELLLPRIRALADRQRAAG